MNSQNLGRWIRKPVDKITVALLWKTIVLWKKKLWYYGHNYGATLRTLELRFMKKKNMINYQKLRNFDL